MSEELTFAGFAAMFRLGPEKITMTKADAVRLAELAQFASDEIAHLRAENARLREAIEMARACIDDKDVIGARQTLTLALGEQL